MTLDHDFIHLNQLLEKTQHAAADFLDKLTDWPAGVIPPDMEPVSLPQQGIGAEAALALFRERYEAWLSGSAGPRYFAFVTGGVTPASLVGDWLTPVYDQNAAGSDESIAPHIELEALSMLRELFNLSSAHTGSFVTGATMSNFVGLAIARQWVGQELGINVAQNGIWGLQSMRVFSGTPHSSIYKALSMLGMGREIMETIPTLPDREAVNVPALAERLQRRGKRPSIVIANAGTVNMVDFDDLQAIANLKALYPFWLHVDAAFGGFAACSAHYQHLVAGMDLADSITIDAHKFLNVPYDAAMQFTRHQALQAQVFQNAAAYLSADLTPGNFLHLTPENSRRLRALATWFTLVAYGKEGYAAIVEQNGRSAQWLAAQIDASDQFRLLAPVSLNGVCFTPLLNGKPATTEKITAYLHALQADGSVFLTPTVFQGIHAVRVSITNWRTSSADMERAWEGMQRVWVSSI